MRKLLWLPAGKPVEFDEAADKIGGGGEGRIFKVPAHPDLVAKLFADPRPRQAKIEAMLRNPPRDDATAGHTSIAWPVGALADAGTTEFVGYLMKRIEKASSLLEICSPDERMAERAHFTFEHLLVVGRNVAHAFKELHAKGYVVGDVNESNILVNDRGYATLVDTDSFQVPRADGGFFRCPVGRPEFTPPELDGRDLKTVDRRTEHDLYGIAVLLFQLLMQGRSPFDGSVSGARSMSISAVRGDRYGSAYLFSRRRSPPRKAPPIDLLAPEVEALFLRCFERGMKDPAARPAAAEWMDALDRACENLQTCADNRQHRFGSHLKSCVWCGHRDRTGLDLFPVPGTAPTTRGTSRPQKALPPPPPPANPTPAPAASKKPQSAGGASLLIDVLSTILGGSSPRPGRGPVSAPTPPPCEIHPGGWVMRMEDPVYPVAGPVIVAMRLGLDRGGGLQGTGDLYNGVFTQPCRVAGLWSYDRVGKIFAIRITMNGWPQPFDQAFRLSGGGNGQYLAVTPEGVRFSIHNVS